jgi:predicted acylesterase/phospholipase RssA
MTIKHIVISGGGPVGLIFFGALEKLEQNKYWNLNEIESIYGTSIGSIIGVFICLKFDWDTLNKYIIDRPWHNAFKVDAKQLIDSYFNKGLYDKKIMEIIFAPLLQAKNLDININLKEFYEYSNIDLHIFTFELNSFETVELSHKTHPELSLLQALTMSSALPGIFMPIMIEDKCYVDGGFMCNYPLNQCLRDHTNKDEVLGITALYNLDKPQININSSLLEYIMCLTNNTMKFIRNTIKTENINNTFVCNINENVLSLDFIQETVKNKTLRQQWIQRGITEASDYLQLKNSC